MNPVNLFRLVSEFVLKSALALFIVSCSAVAQNMSESNNSTESTESTGFEGTLPPDFPVPGNSYDNSSRFLLREKTPDGLRFTEKCLYYNVNEINCVGEASSGQSGRASGIGIGLGVAGMGVVTKQPAVVAIGAVMAVASVFVGTGVAGATDALSLEIRDCPGASNPNHIPEGFLWRSYKPHGWLPYSWISPQRNYSARCANPYCLTRRVGNLHLETCDTVTSADNMPVDDQLFQFLFNTDAAFLNIVEQIIAKEDDTECLIAGTEDECRSFYYTNLLENPDGCLFTPDNQPSRCPQRKKRSIDENSEGLAEEIVKSEVEWIEVDFYTGLPLGTNEDRQEKQEARD